MFRKVLIANRGEIAVRVVRALREAGIVSVAVYSDADRASLAVQMADGAAYLGPSRGFRRSLSLANREDRHRRRAQQAALTPFHPGYGFLSGENAEFVEAWRSHRNCVYWSSGRGYTANGIEDRSP